MSCIEPRREVEEEEEKEESLRRTCLRVKLPVTAPRAREMELVCECCDWEQSDHMERSPSFTASKAIDTSWLALNVCEAVRFIVCSTPFAEAAVSSSAAEEVFGRYARTEGLRCIGASGGGCRSWLTWRSGEAARKKEPSARRAEQAGEEQGVDFAGCDTTGVRCWSCGEGETETKASSQEKRNPGTQETKERGAVAVRRGSAAPTAAKPRLRITESVHSNQCSNCGCDAG